MNCGQGDCHRAEFVGYRVCAGGAGGGVVLRYANWRFVFFVGILPALVTLWIRKVCRSRRCGWSIGGHGNVKSLNHGGHGNTGNESFFTIFRAPYGKSTVALLLLNFFGCLGGGDCFLGFRLIFRFPSSAVDAGLESWYGHAADRAQSVWHVSGISQFWVVADHLGGASLSCFTFCRRGFRAAVRYGAFAGCRARAGRGGRFLRDGFFSGSGLIGSEIYPTRLRARALDLRITERERSVASRLGLLDGSDRARG